MLADVLVCSLLTAALASLALLRGRPVLAARRAVRRDRGRGGDTFAVALAAAPAALLPLAGSTGAAAATTAAGCAALSALWLRKTRRWTVAAHLTWACAVSAGAAFVGYTAIWTATTGLSATGLAGGACLWLLELTAYVLSLAYLWELVDALGSRRWHRRLPDAADTGPATPRLPGPLPFVSIHVPTHNEPPDMVIETLRSLMALDYPGFEVLVLDNNTADEQLWRPVEHFCARHPAVLRFHHLEDWPGYKSGALNFGLSVTDPRAELVAVVDSDYVVEPHWLRATTPMFADQQLAFVQSPQDYRGWRHAAYYRRLYHSYDYFFRVSQRSRDERDAAIFGGTMGVLRRSALVAVGGWDEWCITEDAELSLRLQKGGWSGRHVDTSFGHGVMPLTFEALKGQRFRWCFGGIQILRRHWRSLMPWDRSADNRLSRSQRLAYLSSGFQWFGDLLGLAFLAFLLVAGANVVVGGSLVVRRLSPLLLIVVPAVTGLALLRAVGGVRRAGGGTWREALGAFVMWLALGFTVARACVRGAIEPAGVFLRTPKTRGDTSLRESMRMNRAESALGVVSLAAALGVFVRYPRHQGGGAWVVGVMLAVAGAGYLAAPWNSLAALRADLPERLRRRRSSERARAWSRAAAGPRGRRLGGLAVACAAAAMAVVLLAPSTAPDSTPQLQRREGQRGLLGGVGGRPHTGAPRRPTPSAGATATSPAGTGSRAAPSSGVPIQSPTASGVPVGSSAPAPATSVTSTAAASSTAAGRGSPSATPSSPTTPPRRTGLPTPSSTHGKP